MKITTTFEKIASFIFKSYVFTACKIFSRLKLTEEVFFIRPIRYRLASMFAISTFLTIIFDWLHKVWEKFICHTFTNLNSITFTIGFVSQP